jgi:enoyl-CoA hydratase/carnithine racemase
MNYKNLILKKEDRIATITLNRPEKLNAFDGQTLDEIMEAFREVAEDSNVRAVIITGAGRAFCSGADLSSSGLRFDGVAANVKHMQEVALLIMGIRNMPKPVIAAVNGFAVGGGCNLALACDIIIASEEAKFIEPYVLRGIHPDWGSTYFLPRLVGLAKASDILLTGRVVDAVEADRIGLVSRIVPADKLESATKELAIALAKSAPVAISMAKVSLNQALATDLPTALECEARAVTIANMTEDRNEGIAAFLEKREPVFKGK